MGMKKYLSTEIKLFNVQCKSCYKLTKIGRNIAVTIYDYPNIIAKHRKLFKDSDDITQN
jgi:hypothetical protein